MVTRRDVLIGLGCLRAPGRGPMRCVPGAMSSSWATRSWTSSSRASLPGWSERPSNAIVAPAEENSLAARLYNQSLARLYVNAAGEGVMLVIAYGNTQSDSLQLHRPEVCYPAFGFDADRLTGS